MEPRESKKAEPTERTALLSSPAYGSPAFGPGPLPRNLRRASTERALIVEKDLVRRRSSTGSMPRRARSKPELTDKGFQLRRYWYSMVRPHSYRTRAVVYRRVITTLVVVGVVVFMLGTDEKLERKYGGILDTIEGVTSIVFLLEYIVRVWTIPERTCYAEYSDWGARLRWVFSLESFIDLVATLPWFVEKVAQHLCFLTGKSCGVELPNLAGLRMLRLFRLLRAQPIMEAFDTFARVIFYNSEILLVALIICVVLILVTSTILYYLRPAGDTSGDYSSIFATMYLSIMMLTGQGQPEGTLPWYTKLIIVFTAMFAVAQFAIPASMLTWGFEAEAERRMRKQYERKTKRENQTKEENMSSSSSDGAFSDWEDYERQIVDASDEESSQASSRQNIRQDIRKSLAQLPPLLATEDPTESSAPEALLLIAQQVETMSSEMKRLRERNESLESENARLKGLDSSVSGV